MTVCIAMCEMSSFRRMHNRPLFLNLNQEQGKVRILDYLRYNFIIDKQNLCLKVYLYFIGNCCFLLQDFLEDMKSQKTFYLIYLLKLIFFIFSTKSKNPLKESSQ